MNQLSRPRIKDLVFFLVSLLLLLSERKKHLANRVQSDYPAYKWKTALSKLQHLGELMDEL